MKIPPLCSILLLLCVNSVLAQQTSQTVPPTTQSGAKAAPTAPDAPSPKMGPNGEIQPGFQARHEAFVAIAKKNESKLLFLGDSITAGWGGQKTVWENAFGKYQPANFGIGGDRTQHVLWRLANGELDGFTPKVLVLMIGTNNSGTDTDEGIASGIRKIVELIQQKSPETKILLLGVFPRGEKPENNPAREKLMLVNKKISKLDDGRRIFFLDIGAKFLEADGTLSKEIMPDYLHLSARGYQIWADAIASKLETLMR